MLVYLACSGGMSSSFYGRKMQMALEKKTDLSVGLYDFNQGLTLAENNQLENNINLVYGGISQLNIHNLLSFIKYFSLILVAPQVQYLMAEKEKLVANTPLFIEKMNPNTFGKMSDEGADTLLDQLIFIDDLRGSVSSNFFQGQGLDHPFTIWAMGGDRKQKFYLELHATFLSADIKVKEESYTLEKLYEVPEVLEDIYLFYGVAENMVEKDVEAISKKVDLVLYYPQFHPYQDQMIALLKKEIPTFKIQKGNFAKNYEEIVNASVIAEEGKI